MTKMFGNRENRAGEVGAIVDLEVIDYCFADINMFEEYEMMIEIEKNAIDLIRHATYSRTTLKPNFYSKYLWLRIRCCFWSR